jgi:hypothetical protein
MLAGSVATSKTGGTKAGVAPFKLLLDALKAALMVGVNFNSLKM